MATGRKDESVRHVAEAEKVHFTREQRQNPTGAEGVLWDRVRSGRLGVRFRRQHPIGDFVLDFYCAEERLAVEIDGPLHEQQAKYDEWRDSQLSQHGIRLLRIADTMVSNDIEGVLAMIRDELRS